MDLIEAGRKVSEIASELEVSEQTIYVWRRQARIDAGLEVGVSGLASPLENRPTATVLGTLTGVGRRGGRLRNVTETTFYRRRTKLGGMDVSDARRLRELERENAELKRMAAEQAQRPVHV